MLNDSECFNQNAPYTTIMLQNIKIIIEALNVNIQMEFLSDALNYALNYWKSMEICKQMIL